MHVLYFLMPVECWQC